MSEELTIQGEETISRTIEVSIEKNGLGIDSGQVFPSVTVDFAPIVAPSSVTWGDILDKPEVLELKGLRELSDLGLFDEVKVGDVFYPATALSNRIDVAVTVVKVDKNNNYIILSYIDYNGEIHFDKYSKVNGVWEREDARCVVYSFMHAVKDATYGDLPVFTPRGLIEDSGIPISDLVRNTTNETIVGNKNFSGSCSFKGLLVISNNEPNVHGISARNDLYDDGAEGRAVLSFEDQALSGSILIGGVASPVAPDYAANKSYVDSIVSGLASDRDVVHKTGNETIGGNKEFTGLSTTLQDSLLSFKSKSEDKHSTIITIENYYDDGREGVAVLSFDDPDGAGDVIVRGVASPIYDNDSANKRYVDNAVGNIDYSEINNTPDLSGFITKSVNDLTNYYLKSETYTKAEVADLIGAIQQFHYEIYPTLPSKRGKSNVLYLIGPTGSGSDRYEEYVFANNAFTKIGDTSIDLSGYVTTSALNTALVSYATTQDLEDAFDNYPSYDYNEGEGILGVQKNVSFICGFDGNTYAVGEDNATGDQDKILATTDYVNNAIGGLAAVATSGDYDDLTNKPIIPNVSGKEDSSNKVTSFQSTPDDTHYPSEKLVKDYIDGICGDIQTILISI